MEGKKQKRRIKLKTDRMPKNKAATQRTHKDRWTGTGTQEIQTRWQRVRDKDRCKCTMTNTHAYTQIKHRCSQRKGRKRKKIGSGRLWQDTWDDIKLEMTNHDRRNIHRDSVGSDGKSTVVESFDDKLKDQVRNYQRLHDASLLLHSDRWACWNDILEVSMETREKRAALVTSSSDAMFSCLCHENLEILNGPTSLVRPLVDPSSNAQSSEVSVQTVLLTMQPVVYVLVWLKSTYSRSWAWESWEYAFPVN